MELNTVWLDTNTVQNSATTLRYTVRLFDPSYILENAMAYHRNKRKMLDVYVYIVQIIKGI